MPGSKGLCAESAVTVSFVQIFVRSYEAENLQFSGAHTSKERTYIARQDTQDHMARRPHQIPGPQTGRHLPTGDPEAGKHPKHIWKLDALSLQKWDEELFK